MKRFYRLFPLLCALAACGGQSCSCLKPIQGGFPTDERRHDGALQIRVTQGGVDYLAENGKALVSTLLPGGSTFNIPPSCGGKNEVCCGNPQPMCAIDIGVQDFKLVTKPPSALSFDVRTQLVSKGEIPVAFDLGFGKTHCLVTIDTTLGANGHQDIDITADITFTVDGMTHLTNIALANTQIVNLDKSMIDLKAQNPIADFACTLVQSVAFIKQAVIDQIKTQLTTQISSAADGAFCAKCTTKGDCDSFADDCKSGKCQRQSKCLQEIGAAGKLDVGALFASLSPSTHASLDTLAVLGGYAEVTPSPTGGIALGMVGGGQGDPHNPCVPMRPAPTAGPVPKWSAELGEVEPANQKPYHLALGIHQSHLNTLGWAAFDAGALCLDVGTPSVALLNSQTVGLLMPSLGDLIHGGNAPMYLVMRPQVEPSLTIGDGTFEVDMSGKKSIKSALLTVTAPTFAIDFYAFIDDRYVRILTLTADLTIPIGLDVDGMGQLVPILGDLNKAFTNLKVTHSELLSEAPDKLAKAFPMLLGLAIGQVSGSLKPIALPSVMGLNLSIVAIEPTDNRQFVTFFANVAVGANEPFHAQTEASLTRLLLPPTEAFRVDFGLDPLVAPRAELILGGAGIDGSDRALEWSWSLDEGNLWSPFSPSRQLTVIDPRLWLQGRHHLAVRARMVGAPETTDPVPKLIELLVDTVPPTGSFEVAGNEARFQASDGVSPPSALLYRWSAGAGFSPWSHDDHAQRASGFDPFGLTVEVRDEAGNVGSLDFHGRTTDPAPKSGCGCVVGGARTATGGGLALAAVGALAALLLRRRRASAALVVLVAAGLFASACDHAVTMPPTPMLTKGDLLDPSDQIGRFSDTAAAAGVLHVSAYDESLGDLAYAEIAVADVAKPIVWQWVDGVPTDSPVSNPGGYRKGITDAGDDIGLYTSIAVSADGNPRIAYFDATHQRLKFAYATSRVFTTSIVDQPAVGEAGRFSSLSLDSAGIPSIAYFSGGIPDGMDGYVSRLRLATAKTATPAGPGDWTIIDLDETTIPCSGICPKGQACIQLDLKDKTKKSVCKAVDANPCPKTCATGQACIAAACTPYLGPVSAPDLPEGTGLFATLLRLPTGRAVVYYDYELGDLKLALEGAPGAFAKSFIDGNDPLTDVGQFAAPRVAPDGTIHVAYVDAIGDRLLYKTVKAGVASMTPEVIDDGMRMDGPHPVGAGASLWTDGATVRVVYQDQQTVDLWQAARGGGGWGAPMPLHSGAAGFGFYPHLVSDGGNLYLTEFVYDRAAQASGMNLGTLAVERLP